MDSNCAPSVVCTPFIRQLFATFTVCLSMFSWGNGIGWTAVTDPQLRHNATGLSITDEESSWVGASYSLGGILGSLIGGFLCESIGRKRIIQALSLLSCLCYLTFLFAWNIWIICIPRLVLGVTVAASSTACSLYIAEISSSRYRGSLGSCVSLSVAIGISFCMILGATVDWRKLSLICAIPQGMGFLVLFAVPESPYYLAQNNHKTQMNLALSWLLCNDEALVEKAKIDITDYLSSRKNHNQQMQRQEEVQLQQSGLDTDAVDIDVTQDTSFVPKLGIMCSLMAFSRLTGVTQLSYYMVDILEHSNVSLNPKWASAGVSIFEIIGSVLTIGLSDKAGRKILLVLSGLGMGLANLFLLLAQSGLFKSESGFESTAVTLSSLSMFFVFFTLGFGGIPFVMLGEIFPPDSKGLSASVSVTLIWILNFVNTKSYFWILGLVDYNGFYATFLSFSILSALVVSLFLPETKNKTLAEVQESFSAWKICSWH